MRAYKTVIDYSSIEYTVNKSRFIGHCLPVENEEAVQSALRDIKKQYWDATHNCYAFSIRQNGGIMRCNDDGEPSGTAGMPILEVIKGMGMEDVLVIVTRYFGGVLLGAGGLVRAYSTAASHALDNSESIIKKPCVLYYICTDYKYWNIIEPQIKNFGSIENTVYSERVEASVAIPKEESEAFLDVIVEMTDGSVNPMPRDEIYCTFKI